MEGGKLFRDDCQRVGSHPYSAYSDEKVPWAYKSVFEFEWCERHGLVLLSGLIASKVHTLK